MGSATLWGAWVNSAQSLRPLPAFVCVVFAPVQRDFVGAWVNSAQSLRLLPYFVCVVFVAARLVGVVGKFRRIVAAVAGFCLCCVCAGARDFVGREIFRANRCGRCRIM